MQHRLWKFRVRHMIEAISKIERYSAGHTFETFQQNDMVTDAVIRNLEILGEAMRHIPPDVIERHSRIPWSEMRGMRNVIVHGYDVLRLERIWDTVQNHLPPLVPLLHEVLDTEDESA